MIHLGIDPGLQGAIAVFDEGEPISVDDLPTMRRAGRPGGNQLDLPGLVEALRDIQVMGRPETCVYLEQVHAAPGQGVSAMFHFGEGYGALRGVLCCLGYEVKLVSPRVWKRRAGLLRQDKDASRLLAIELWPRFAERLRRKKDVGRAEALLIGQYGREIAGSSGSAPRDPEQKTDPRVGPQRGIPRAGSISPTLARFGGPFFCLSPAAVCAPAGSG